MNQGLLLGIREYRDERLIPPYFIACTKATGELVGLMQHLLAESNRAENKGLTLFELSEMALPVPLEPSI
jgi:hypothetical protein